MKFNYIVKKDTKMDILSIKRGVKDGSSEAAALHGISTTNKVMDKVLKFSNVNSRLIYVLFSYDQQNDKKMSENIRNINQSLKNRIWWYISKKLLLEKEEVVDINKNENYILIDQNEFWQIDFLMCIEIFKLSLVDEIENWSRDIPSLSRFKTFGQLNNFPDRGLEDGEEKLIIDYLEENGYVEVKQSLYYPTIRLRVEIPEISGNLNTVFVAMKFNGNNGRYNAIKRAIVKKNKIPIRADNLTESEVITEQIFREIKNSEIVICDLSDKNNGVYFEAGYAMSNDKRIIFINKEGNEAHFDVSHIRYLNFADNEDLFEKLVKWM